MNHPAPSPHTKWRANVRHRHFAVLALVPAVAILMFVASVRAWIVWPWQDKDRLLLAAVQAEDLPRFKRLLRAGANPNRVFGSQPEDWVMCEVADEGRLAFLKAAQDHGGDIHMRNTTPPIERSLNAIYSAPLLCAISMHSYETFRYLLDQGVDSQIRVFTGEMPRGPNGNPALIGRAMYRTPVTVAVSGNSYRMIYDMMQLRPLNWEEKWVLKRISQNPTRGIDTSSDAFTVWLPKVLELAREQGMDDIDPDEPSDEAKRLGIPRRPSAPPPPTRPAE